MERDLTAESSYAPIQHDFSASATPVGDWLDRACSQWMAIGVPYDVFWNGDYTQLKYYEEAHEYVLKQRNYEMWLQGMYFYDAISTALARAFDKRSHAEYAKEPYRITPMTEMEQEIEKQKKVNEFRNQLNALCRKMERKHSAEKHNISDRGSVVIADGSGKS